jgi:hypothetical protein
MRIVLVIDVLLAAVMLTAGQNSAEQQLEAAIHQEFVVGNLQGAIEQYKAILAQNGNNHVVAAQALFHMGQCQEKLG